MCVLMRCRVLSVHNHAMLCLQLDAERAKDLQDQAKFNTYQTAFDKLKVGCNLGSALSHHRSCLAHFCILSPRLRLLLLLWSSGPQALPTCKRW